MIAGDGQGEPAGLLRSLGRLVDRAHHNAAVIRNFRLPYRPAPPTYRSIAAFGDPCRGGKHAVEPQVIQMGDIENWDVSRCLGSRGYSAPKTFPRNR